MSFGFQPPPKPKLDKSLNLQILATNWGFEGTPESFCKKAKNEGYDGVEIWVPRDQAVREAYFNAIAKNNLSYGLLAGNWGASFDENYEVFQSQIETAAELKPLFVNCHSGKDFFSPEQNQKFIDYGSLTSKRTGVPVYHETHRGRVLFAAEVSKNYLRANPELRLTLDISHWCCVSESLLEDQNDAVNEALDHTDHIHSRVGFAEGPQIPDPRAPEFKMAVDTHFGWWDNVVELKINQNESLTMTTEFGPPGYMWTLPYTKQPVADLWAVNAHMMRLWRERYQS